MPEGLGPRLAVETGFLIALAVLCAILDFDPLVIVLVMAIGWILVVLAELLAWRARPEFVSIAADVVEVAPAEPAAVHAPPAQPQYVAPPVPLSTPAPEPAVAVEPAPPPAPEAPPVSEYDFSFSRPAPPEDGAETAVLAAGERAGETVEAPVRPDSAEEEVGETSPPVGFETSPLQGIAERLPPLQPRPRRRWFGLGPRPRENRRQDTAGEEEKI